MKIESGKFYRTQGGEKAGPMIRSQQEGYFWSANVGGKQRIYFENGRHGGSHTPNDPHADLVAEWVDGPVREVVTTRREVVPGVYGRLEVVDSDQDRVHLRLAAKGGITLASNSTHVLSRDELDQLITNLTALRDVL